MTYSRADLKAFPTREIFGTALVNCFNGSGKVTVDYWACCREEHESTSGYHYHACVKLSGPKRWGPVKNALTKQHGIIVNFSESHDCYHSAYKYVTKTDKDVYISDNHPELENIGSPKTKTCMRAYREKYTEKRKLEKVNKKDTTSKKPCRLSNIEVSEYIIRYNVKTETDLFARANARKDAGKKDLASFLLCKSPKSLQDLLTTTWKMHSASAQLHRNATPRMQLIREHAEKDCIPECDGQWLRCATEVLRNNNLHPFVFADALRDLLVKGRGKFRNILIVGPANCAKTFLLSPLQKIFETFCNPANDRYAWLGAESAEVIFLNDFRWSPEMISWKELLLLLEGQTVHLPSPKNHYNRDIAITADTPIFATGKSEITYVGKYNTTDITENEMMAVRWKVFKFKRQITQQEQIELQPCNKCFSQLVLMGEM